MELNQIPQNPNNWGNVADLLNENSGKIEAETAKLNNVTTKFKGYFSTSTSLSAKWPSPLVGDTAWVGATYPGVVYRCDVAGTWLATTDVPPSNTVNLSEYATQDAVSNEFASVRSDLNEAITNLANSGYLFLKIANPDTVVDAPTQNVFCLATKAGTYTYFLNYDGNPITLSKDGIYALKYILEENGYWFVESLTQIDDEPVVNSNNLIKSGGINNAILKPIIHNEKKEDYYARGKYLVTSSGTKESSTLFYSYEYLVSDGDVVIVKYANSFSSPDYSAVSLWNDNTFVQDVLPTPTVGEKYIYLQIPSGVNRLIVSINDDVYKPILPIIDQLSQNDIAEKGYIPEWYRDNILIFDDGHTESSTFETISYGVKEGEEYELNISDNISDELSYASLWNNDTSTFVKSIASGLLDYPTSIQFTIPSGINELRVIATDGVELKKIYRKKHISALFIGNSVNQDHITYLPWLLKNTYPDIDFEIYIAYKGSYTIKAWVENIINGTEKMSVFSYARNTDVWTNIEEVSFDSMFRFSIFDIISFEGYLNPGTYIEDTSYYKTFVDYIRTKQNSPLKFGYLLHQTYTHDDGTYSWTESEIWEDIVNAAKQALLTTPVDILFACGGVSKLVESSFGTSFLTPDTIHNNEGLPCIMGAYVVMEKLSSYLGLKSGVLNNPLRITQSIYERLHIPGINGSLQLGTESQYKEAQEAAVNAVKFGDSLVANTCIDLL